MILPVESTSTCFPLYLKHIMLRFPQVYIGEITVQKEISRILKDICKTWLLTGLQHLKRVRRKLTSGVCEIIICRVDDGNCRESNVCLNDLIGDKNFNIHGLTQTVKSIAVPKEPPSTYKQFQECCVLWPTQFRADKYLEKVLSGEIFTSEDRTKICRYLNRCSEVAEYGQEKIGVIVVNPETDNVVAIAHDLRHMHPLQHATMVAIDLVAKSQGGGAWNIDSPHCRYFSHNKTNELSESETSSNLSKALPYLCTSYDLYITREPCVMCAMALVHSRIRRVFYTTSVPWGALGTSCKMNILPGLNHHYEVWKVVIDNQRTTTC